VRARSRRSFLCGDCFQKPKAALWKKSTAGGELDPAEPSTFNPPFLAEHRLAEIGLTADFISMIGGSVWSFGGDDRVCARLTITRIILIVETSFVIRT
jgi:hypothetical protein